MQSEAPSSEWDDDAVTALALMQGWNIMRDGPLWTFSRLLDDYAVEVIHAESRQEALYHLSRIK